MTGFNLRNLAWHGFLHSDEFPAKFLSLIFAVIITIPNLAVSMWRATKYDHTATRYADIDRLKFI